MESNDPNRIVNPHASAKCISPAPGDEIYLWNMLKSLWRQRYLVVLVTMIVIAIALAYAFYIPEIYQANANVAVVQNYGIKTEEQAALAVLPAVDAVFSELTKNLQSREIQTQFWQEGEVAKRLRVDQSQKLTRFSEEWFVQNLKFVIPSKEEKEFGVFLSGTDPDIISMVLNGYVTYVGDYSGRSILENMALKLKEQKNQLRLQIEKVRIKATREYEREFIKLKQVKEAAELQDVALLKEKYEVLKDQFAIAERLKIVEPRKYLQEAPYYFRGMLAIQAEIDQIQQRIEKGEGTSVKVMMTAFEIDQLKQRANEDLFVDGVLELQDQLDALENIKIESIKVSPIKFEKSSAPSKPKSPDRRLIIALGSLLGLIAGVFIALIRTYTINVNF